MGYLPDTPLPWKPGNSAFAAHRDRLFRPLERIRVGDDIRLSTIHGDFQYKVTRSLVVNPKDLWVLDPSPDADLTLITCFPFEYVGRAPKRFIVQARKIEPSFETCVNVQRLPIRIVRMCLLNSSLYTPTLPAESWLIDFHTLNS